MRVLLVISDYKKGFPYIQDLERELKAKGIFVNVIDIENLYQINNDGSIFLIAEASFIKILLRLPKVRTYVRAFFLKRHLKTLRGKFDAVGIHSYDPIFIHLTSELQKISPNLSVTIWGSDFYRADDAMRQKKRKILDQCQLIIFGSPSNEEDFNNYYKVYREKTVVSGFGVTKFDTINQILAQSSKADIKFKLGLPADKFVVTIGYNGASGQQHEKLINELAELPQWQKDKLFLLFQMTYGGTKEYRTQVELKVKASGILYKMIHQFVDDQETANIRIATDIVLNAQISDGFSASIQEHIYATNIVVVGDWLRYKSLDLSGVFYLKSSLENFGKMITDIICNFEEYQEIATQNPEKMYELSSWKNKIPTWIAIYQGIEKKELFATTL